MAGRLPQGFADRRGDQPVQGSVQSKTHAAFDIAIGSLPLRREWDGRGCGSAGASRESARTGRHCTSVGRASPSCHGYGQRADPRRVAVSRKTARSPRTMTRQPGGGAWRALSMTSGPTPAGSPIVTPRSGNVAFMWRAIDSRPRFHGGDVLARE